MRTIVPLALVCGALVTACTGEPESATEEGSAAIGSRQTGAPTQAPATTPLSGPDAVVVDWPAEAPAERGAEQWAVYLAVGPEGDPALTEPADFLRTHGYSADEEHLLACDGGAPEALLRHSSDHAVAVYFEWRADAGDFLTLMKPPGSQPGAVMFVDMLRITRDCT